MGGRSKTGPKSNTVVARDRMGRALAIAAFPPSLPPVPTEFEERGFIPASVVFASSASRRFRVVPRADLPRPPVDDRWKDVPLPSEVAACEEETSRR